MHEHNSKSKFISQTCNKGYIISRQILQRQSYNNIHKLWKNVILQSVIDARSSSSKKLNRYRKQLAIKWLEEAIEEFEHVCIMADADPSSTMSRIIRVLSEASLKRRGGHTIHSTSVKNPYVYQAMV